MTDPARSELLVLVELAELHGVLPSYLHGAGKERSASSDTLIAVLNALGAPLDGMRDVPDALRSRRAELEAWVVPPVVVAWEREGAVDVALRLPRSQVDRDVECRLLIEGGELREWQTELGGGRPSRVAAGSRLSIPGELPMGVHELRLHVAGREASTWIIRAPRTTWDSGRRPPRDFGLFLPLHALRTESGWGTGDLSDLRSLSFWSGARGARFVGTLPLMAAFLAPGAGPYEPGPYAPVSRLFWNELYLDVERAVAAEGSLASFRSRELLDSVALQEDVARLRDAPRVRHAEVMALKRRVLEALVADTAPVDEPLLGPLAEYAEQRPDAVDYARFRAAGERLATPWSEWPQEMREGRIESDLRDEAAFRYHLYVQRAFEVQLAELAGGAALYLDLPLGSHPAGYDVWRHRDAFARGLSVGAPPDAFFAQGQSWGFPPLHPERTREDGHAYLRRSLAKVMRAAGMVRLDHVMALHRLYCVPAGHDARDGAYVRYPSEELYALLCLESHRWKCEVVGEDLGTVPPEVHESMERHRLRRMYVVPFELDDAADPPRLRTPDPLSVASLGTHDLPPFASFWSGEDLVRREKSGLLSAAEAAEGRAGRAKWRAMLESALGLERHGTSARRERDGSGAADAVFGPSSDTLDALRAALGFLAASPARHLLINVEDLWLETEPQNVPGTAGDRNWTLKARHRLEDWAQVPRLEEILAELSRLRLSAGGREPAKKGRRKEGAWVE